MKDAGKGKVEDNTVNMASTHFDYVPNSSNIKLAFESFKFTFCSYLITLYVGYLLGQMNYP